MTSVFLRSALLVLVASVAPSATASVTPIEGFSRLLTAANSGDRPTDRSLEVRSPSSWVFGTDGTQRVIWETCPVPADPAQEVTFVWSAGLSGEVGTHELAVDGQPLLTFSSGPFREPIEWQGHGAVLRYDPGLAFRGGESHGTMSLRLPRQQLTPGRPVELTVRALDGRAWFMLHHFRDSSAWARSARMRLPTGHRLIVTPTKSFYLPPARIAWRAPYALPDDQAPVTDLQLTAELLDVAGTPIVEPLHQVLHTGSGERAVPIDLWSSDRLPAGSWRLRLTFATAGAVSGTTWDGVLTIGDASVFDASEAGAEAALERAATRLDSGSVLADISLPSLAWTLQDARRRLQGLADAEAYARDYGALIDTVRAVAAAAEAIGRGLNPYAGQAGFAVRAYRSAWDGQLQPYGLYVPPSYDPAYRWPLVILLHGSDQDQSSAMGDLFGAHRAPPPYADHGYLVATPDSRGLLGWDGAIGEDDVLRVLADVERTHAVDTDRVYLTGPSMGGAGTWSLGLHYPDLFAALAPVCAPASWRVLDDGPFDALTAAVRDELNPEAWAENALHLPVAIQHGDVDQVVSVEHSRRMAARLRELGYDVEYTEYPGIDHDVWNQAYAGGRMFAWFGRHRRDPWPARVLHVTTNPDRYGRNAWVWIEGLQTPHVFARVDAEVAPGSRVTVHTDNVRQLSLRLDTPLLDAGADVQVEVDGVPCYAGPVPDGGWLRMRLDDAGCTPGGEAVGAAGPPFGGVWAALLDYHVVVYGTQGPGDVTKRYRAFAERLTRKPDRLRLDLPVLADTSVTADLQARANLVLIGTPATNLMLADVAPDLPLRWEAGVPSLGWLHADTGEALLFTYPHPRHPARRLLVLTGSTIEAIEQIRYIPKGAPEVAVLGADGRIRATASFTRDWLPVKP